MRKHVCCCFRDLIQVVLFVFSSLPLLSLATRLLIETLRRGCCFRRTAPREGRPSAPGPPDRSARLPSRLSPLPPVRILLYRYRYRRTALKHCFRSIIAGDLSSLSTAQHCTTISTLKKEPFYFSFLLAYMHFGIKQIRESAAFIDLWQYGLNVIAA